MDKELYKEEIEKQAAFGAAIGTLAKGVKKVAPTISKGIKSFSSMSSGKRSLIGAGTGSAIRGITYKPQEGQDNVKGRLGAMTSGAITGAMAGNLASKSNISNLGSKVGGAGEKIFNSAANMTPSGSFSQKATNIMSDAGIGMNTAGNKIKDYFSN